MSRATLGAIVLAALALGACRDGPDWRVLQLYGGQGSLDALRSPVRVEAFRIAPESGPPEAGVPFVGVHRVVAGPVEVPPDLAAALSSALLDADTYDWRHAKGDPFRPTYGLRFAKDVSRVDLALDLESRMLTVHRHGRRIGVEDFDAAAPRIAEILRRSFP